MVIRSDIISNRIPLQFGYDFAPLTDANSIIFCLKRHPQRRVKSLRGVNCQGPMAYLPFARV